MPDAPHGRQGRAEELQATGHVVLGQERPAVGDGVLARGHADPDGRDPPAVPRQQVQRPLYLLDHERAGVVAERVDEGEDDDTDNVVLDGASFKRPK